TALVTSVDFVCVVLLVTQGLNLGIGSNDIAVADNTYLAVALDLALGEHTTSDGTDSGGLEQGTDLCRTGVARFVDWLEHALEGLRNFFDSTVDNGGVEDVDAIRVSVLSCLVSCSEVEAK